MNKLKLFFALLLMAAGVHTAWAQTYMLGNQVTDVNQLSTEKLYAISHQRLGSGSDDGFIFIDKHKSGSETEYYIGVGSTTFPANADAKYVWLLEDAGSGKYYLRNISMDNCYILQMTGSGDENYDAVYAGTSGTKANFTIAPTENSSYPNTFTMTCEDVTGNNALGARSKSGADITASNYVCQDKAVNHGEYIYEVVSLSFVDEGGNTLSGVTAAFDGSATLGKLLSATYSRGAYFQALSLVSIKDNATGHVYTTADDLDAEVATPVAMTVTLRTPIRDGGYYKIKHATDQKYMQVGTYYDPYNSSNRPTNSLIVGSASAAPATTDLFRLDEAGEGKYYIYNVGTGRYLQAVGTGSVTATTTTEGEKGRYYITNLTIPGHPEYMAIAKESVADPTTHADNNNTRYFLHNDPGTNNDTKVVGWSQTLATGDNASTEGKSLWMIDEAENLNLAVKFNTLVPEDERGEETEYWSTFYSSYHVAKPANTTVYYATYADENNKYLHLETLEGDVIPANFAVILKSVGEGRKQYVSVANNSDTEDVAAAREANKLQGTCNANDRSDNAHVKGGTEGGQVYVLSGTATEGMGFFNYIATYLPQYKAYYVHPTADGDEQQAIRGFMFYTSDGTATRIDLNPAEGTDTVVFDLSGRRVTNAKNGLYIVNGKKVRL